MNAIVERFLSLSLAKKIVLWAGTLLLLTFLYWQYFYSARLEERTKLEEEIGEINTRITEKQRLANNLSRYKAEVKELDGYLAKALEELPDQKEIDTLLDSVSDLARLAGLEVTQFSPKDEEFSDFYASVPVQIEVEGNFHQMATFFDEVGHLPRVVNIDRIGAELSEETKAQVTIKGSCYATTFRYLSEEERRARSAEDAAPVDGAKGKRRAAKRKA